MKKTLLAMALVLSSWAGAQQRTETILTDGWQFVSGPKDGGSQSWQTVSVPHDWAISGPFDKKWDLQIVRIEQNGEKEATEKSGRSGSLPWIGEGHYRRTLLLPERFGHAELLFDGAMAEPTVSINGQKAGYWAYGYNSFRVDITPFVKPGENLLEVDLQNMEESSRWYPGAGIYRPVTLIVTPQATRIDDWSTFVRTTTLDNGKGSVELSCETRIADRDKAQGLRLYWRFFDPQGRLLSELEGAVGADGTARQRLFIKKENARLWTPETPNIYKVELSLCQEGLGEIDRQVVRTGLRTVSVSKKGGFQLNGQTRKIKGVCLHHDLGPLGAAVNKAALIRQIKTMKDMGCDAIRTSHNMPSQWQMELCDSLGMMVMAESFDMWIYRKCKNGYARFFREWSDRDITNLVLAHRNHPSIVMWSIGNEIPEQGMQGGREMAQHLQDLCHRLDPTRPVTQGCDRPDNALATGFIQSMDVPGLNYRLHRYQSTFDKLWHGFLLGSETASTVSSRGVYYFPVKPTDKGVHPDGQCSGYDVEWCSWSNLPDDDWRWQDDKPWVIGEFVWTGYDYLGEPTPYDEYWPSRSSYFGICDLAGLPKDRYYLYRSHWLKDQHTLHLLPHWTWPGREGEVTPVYCYTDYDEAELFVNGKSQGRIRKAADVDGKVTEQTRLDRYRLRWNDVKYEPGELKVVAYDESGKPAAQKSLRTAGKPTRLNLDVWTQCPPTLSADGQDLAFVTVSLSDKKGTFVPTAADQLRFEVSGAGTFRAVCNGDATSLEPFTQPTMRLFSGQLVVVVQAAKQPGTLKLRVIDDERHLSQTVSIPVK